MYQWIEKEFQEESHHRGHRERVRRVEYRKEWKNHHVDSGRFREHHHQNPNAMPFKEKSISGLTVQFGGYILADTQIAKLNNKIPINYSKEAAERAAKATDKQLKSLGY